MKKTIFCLVVIVMLFSLFAPQSIRPVAASGIGEGNWVLPGATAGTIFTTVDIEKAAETAPSWVRLFSEGIKISDPTKICYSFRRGAFHWVPKIMQLKKGNWVNVASTIEYINGEEGGTFACAKPSEAGTYALFAYYNGPKETMTQKPDLPVCTGAEITNKTIGNSGDLTTITQPIYFVSNIEFTKLEILSFSPTNYAFKDNIKWASIAFDDIRKAYVGTIYGLYVDGKYNTLDPEGVVVRLSNENCYIDVSGFDWDS